MSVTRDNHYVPQWYQKGFFEDGRKTLKYLDLRPENTLPDGRIIRRNTLFDSPTSRCFSQKDLYTTFFGGKIDDGIENILFRRIDDIGSHAVKALTTDDVSLWHKHLKNFFEYMDSQKLRTPKGLDWLKKHYRNLSQNELMREMESVRNMHCTLWGEGVREIVSSEKSGIKFLISDHPVTIYNYAVSPNDVMCFYPDDPGIELKGSQTIYPLNRNFCLIISNLEYIQNPKVDPLSKRTFARQFRDTLVRTDAFLRSRRLNDAEVVQINLIIKSRARRFIAAGMEDWLYPEHLVTGNWPDFREVLLPPDEGRLRFGGEMVIRYEDGSVHYQDQFGRTEKPRDFLQKTPPEQPLRAQDPCGCGSGRTFKTCCQRRSIELRPSWTELSIRERNMTLYEAVADILELNQGKTWVDIRRDLTDEKIQRIYTIFEALWPLETDLFSLLPKPDGKARALYTGIINPPMIMEFVVGATLYFDEIIVQNPFLHPQTVKKDFNPVENPGQFQQEFLQSVHVLVCLMPFIESGSINLVPDPCYFNRHLQQQMLDLAKERVGEFRLDPEGDPRTWSHMMQNFKRTMLAAPEEFHRDQAKKAMPGLNERELDEFFQDVEKIKEEDPLSVLRPYAPGEAEKGYFNSMRIAPNFEISMFLAQATGAFLFTDCQFRWNEFLMAQHHERGRVEPLLDELTRKMPYLKHGFSQDIMAVSKMRVAGRLDRYRSVIQELYSYTIPENYTRRDRKTVARQLTTRFGVVHAASQRTIKQANHSTFSANIHCLIPKGGLTHRNVSRMLLTAGVHHHLNSVPMAFFVERPDIDVYERMGLFT